MAGKRVKNAWHLVWPAVMRSMAHACPVDTATDSLAALAPLPFLAVSTAQWLPPAPQKVLQPTRFQGGTVLGQMPAHTCGCSLRCPQFLSGYIRHALSKKKLHLRRVAVWKAAHLCAVGLHDICRISTTHFSVLVLVNSMQSVLWAVLCCQNMLATSITKQ